MKVMSVSFQQLSGVFSGDVIGDATESILNKINAFVGIIDITNLRFIWVNKHFINKIGYSISELHSMSSDEFLWHIHPDFRNDLVKALLDTYSGKNNVGCGCYKIQCRDKNWIWVLATSAIYHKDDNGNVIQLLIYATEIDVVRLQNKLIKINKEGCVDRRSKLMELLSHREREIVELITNGETDKEISKNLNISIHTAKTHRKHIIHKLGVKNSNALVKYAIENKLE